MSIGFTFPFSKSSGSVGFFETTATEISAVRENLKSLMLTNWGERVNHFYLGCNFKEFLFENMDVGELKAKIAERVLSQVEMWMPFVVVQSLNILLSGDDASIPDNGFRVRVEFGVSSNIDLSSRLDVDVTQ